MPDFVKTVLKEARLSRLQQLRAARKKPSLRRAVIPEPRGIEISYASQMLQVQREVDAEVVKGAAQLQQSQQPDGMASTKKIVAGMLAALLPSIVAKHGLLTFGFNFKKNDYPAANMVGLNAALPSFQQATIQQSWVHENVSLITNANAEQLARIESAVMRAMRSGTGGKELQQEIRDSLKAETNRVKLIARDQIGKLNGQLDMAKQTNAGVEKYRWRTSRDERTRPEHAAREGLIFRWDTPPAGGHPGQAIRCRCTAEPVLEDLFFTGKELQEAKEKDNALNAARREQAMALSAKGREATRAEARARIRASKRDR